MDFTLYFYLLNLAMELLQGLNLQMSVLLDTSQSLYGSLCCCHVGEVRNLRLYSCLTDVAVIASCPSYRSGY